MNSNRSKVFLLVLVFIGLVFWWLWPREATQSVDGRPVSKSSVTPRARAPESRDKDGITTENAASIPGPGTDEQKRARMLELRQIMNQANQPVQFWGKVVDQDSAPLPSVKVRVSIKHTVETVPGSTRDVFNHIDLVTDSQGLFSITGRKGALLGIEELKKEGYEAPYTGNRAYWYAPPIVTMQFTPDAARPEVFRMWKKSGAEKLVVGDKFYGIVPDGRSYAIDLFDEKKIEGSNVGDFKISIRRPVQISPGSKYDWNCTIEGIGGGVIETRDEFMYRAPESGYQPRYEVAVSSSNPQWSDRATRRLYLKSNDGKAYARLEVEIFANYQDKAVFSVKYHANPHGSRNLEYDPLQNVVKP